MAASSLDYPVARIGRTAPGPASGAAGLGALAVPRTRTFPFYLALAIANTRHTVSTSVITGPALVQSVALKFQAGETTPTNSFEIGWSRTPITESGVANTVAKSWTRLLELLQSPAGAVNAMHDGFFGLLGGGQMYMTERPLNIAMAQEAFYLTLTYQQQGAAFSGWVEGVVTVLESVSPEALANFL